MSFTRARAKRVSVERGDNPVVAAQRLYVQFLKGLFNFNEKGCLRWEPDNELTEIVIQTDAPVKLDVVRSRPAITVVSGPIQFQGLSIDNMQYMNMVTERRVRSDLMSGHFVVYCISESAVLSQWIASMVTHGTRVNQRLLEGRGGFHQIARPGPSQNAPSPPGALVPGDPQGLVMVQVNIPYTFQWTWSQTPTAPSDERSIEMITGQKRASDFPYTSPPQLEEVQLAMSTAPVQIQRINTSGLTSLERITISEGNDRFQSVVASSPAEEEQE